METEKFDTEWPVVHSAYGLESGRTHLIEEARDAACGKPGFVVFDFGSCKGFFSSACAFYGATVKSFLFSARNEGEWRENVDHGPESERIIGHDISGLSAMERTNFLTNELGKYHEVGYLRIGIEASRQLLANLSEVLMASHVLELSIEAHSLRELKKIISSLPEKEFWLVGCMRLQCAGTLILKAVNRSVSDLPEGKGFFWDLSLPPHVNFLDRMILDGSDWLSLNGTPPRIQVEWKLNGENIPGDAEILHLKSATMIGMNSAQQIVRSDSGDFSFQKRFWVLHPDYFEVKRRFQISPYYNEQLRLRHGDNHFKIPSQHLSFTQEALDLSLRFTPKAEIENSDDLWIEYNGSCLDMRKDADCIVFQSISPGLDFNFTIFSSKNLDFDFEWFPISSFDIELEKKGATAFRRPHIFYEIGFEKETRPYAIFSRERFSISRQAFAKTEIPKTFCIQIEPHKYSNGPLDGILIINGTSRKLEPWYNAIQPEGVDLYAGFTFEIELKKPNLIQVFSWFS